MEAQMEVMGATPPGPPTSLIPPDPTERAPLKAVDELKFIFGVRLRFSFRRVSMKMR